MGLATKVSYAAVADMERRIEQYFAARANSTTEIYSPKKGEVVEVCEQAPLHLTGLCDYLEISAEELDAYQQKPEFAELIRRAKKKCEAYLVDQCVKLHKADFVLKNNDTADGNFSQLIGFLCLLQGFLNVFFLYRNNFSHASSQ